MFEDHKHFKQNLSTLKGLGIFCKNSQPCPDKTLIRRGMGRGGARWKVPIQYCTNTESCNFRTYNRSEATIKHVE